MILTAYEYKINSAAVPKNVAKRIAAKLNQDDPFNVYIIIVDPVTKKYYIEKQAIKGMK